MGGNQPYRVVLFILILASPGLRARAEDSAPVDPAVVQSLRDAAELLADPSREKRREAEGKLWGAGAAAEPVLREYMARAEAEGNNDGARRAELVLKYLPYGLTDPTADTLMPLIDRYLGATDVAEKRRMVVLLNRGKEGAAAIVELVTRDESVDVREELFRYLRQYGADRNAQRLIGAGRNDLAERWLALGSTLPDQVNNPRGSRETGEAIQQDYAVLLLLTDGLDAKIAEVTAALQKPTDEAHDAVKHRLLAYFYRVKGLFPAAIEQARAAGSDGQNLLRQLLWRTGDWIGAAELERDRVANTKNPGDLGALLAFEYLAGDEQKFIATSARHFTLLEAMQGQAALGFPYILCSRPDLALDAYRKGKATVWEFESLCAQSRYVEAFKLLDDATAAGAVMPLDLQRSAAGIYRGLGMTARADELTEQCFNNAIQPVDSTTTREAQRVIALLAADEVEWGQKERAIEHVGKALDLPSANDMDTFLITKLFPGDLTVNYTWMVLREKSPGDAKSETLKRAVAIRGGTLSIDEMREMLNAGDARMKAMLDYAGLPETLYAKIVASLNGADPSAETQGELDQLVKRFRIPADGTQAVKRAERMSDTRDAEKAVEAYGKAWEADKAWALPLYLKGLALRRAGREDEARKAIALAEMLPLGRALERHQLWLDLEERKFPEDAARQRDWAIRLDRGQSGSDHALRVAAIDRWNRGKPGPAAELFAQALPGLSQGNFYLFKLRYYFNIAADYHTMKADALLAAGDPDGAMKELRLCQLILPVSTMPMRVAAKLEALGHRAEADELINVTAAAHEANLARFPEVALFHNDYAWLLAKTHRRLDDALIHAENAVVLAPGHFAFLDTLAEVYFHRGDREQCIESMNLALEAARKTKIAANIALAEKRLKHFQEDPIPTGADKPDGNESE